MNPLLIDKRHMALQTWVDKVLKEETLGNCAEIKHFLEETKLEEGLVAVKVRTKENKPTTFYYIYKFGK